MFFNGGGWIKCVRTINYTDDMKFVHLEKYQDILLKFLSFNNYEAAVTYQSQYLVDDSIVLFLLWT